MVTSPQTTPQPGFYYHFKHDQSHGVAHHAYEVLGVSWHTESGEWSVVYRPLYELVIDGVVVKMCNRPLEMFLENTEVAGEIVARFQQITDEDVIAELGVIKTEME